MKHTALITGASRGIGAALACRFAAEGYHLALCCHNSYETLQALATKLETTYSIQVLCFRGDVGDYTFICDMVQKTLDTFGQIDVYITDRRICDFFVFGQKNDISTTGFYFPDIGNNFAVYMFLGSSGNDRNPFTDQSNGSVF